MNNESINKIKEYLHLTMSTLYRMEGPTTESDVILHRDAMNYLRRALAIVSEVKPAQEIGINVRVDIGDTVEKLNECEKACQNVIMAKIKLDKLLGEAYGPQ